MSEIEEIEAVSYREAIEEASVILRELSAVVVTFPAYESIVDKREVTEFFLLVSQMRSVSNNLRACKATLEMTYEQVEAQKSARDAWLRELIGPQDE